jgi:hypothetical protein
MSEYNRAIRLAQRVLLDASNRVGQREIGYHQYIEDPEGPALRKAVGLLDALIEPETESE